MAVTEYCKCENDFTDGTGICQECHLERRFDPLPSREPLDSIDKFHKHLDVCRQCRENPFALCDTGSNLLMLAAQACNKWSHEFTP